MTTTSTYGRQVVVPLTNKSGGGVIAGDVVIVDTSNNDSFTTTTSAGATGTVGIAQETIASNAVGRVLTNGYAALVNTNASVTRGNFGKTHTVAKQATDAGSSRVTGTFVQFLTGGTTPDGIVFHPDLGGASLTNPMTTKGDIILGDTSGVPSRLGAGTSGYVLTSAGPGAFPAWAAASGGFLGTLTEATLGADVTLGAGDAFSDGPTTTPAAGVYDVWARVTFASVSAAQMYFVARLLANGSATPIDEVESQWVMANTSQLSLILAARVTANGTDPIKVSGASSNASQLMKRDPRDDSSGLHRATLLRLTRVS